MRLKKIEKEQIELLGLNPKYVYDHGFGLQVYHCTGCDGHNLKMKPKGGFSSPDYECQDCDNICGAPKNTKIHELISKVDTMFSELVSNL